MLPVKFRLKNKKEFNTLFCGGKSSASENLSMKHQSNVGEGLKIGFSVGLRFSKKAAERNKVKRWLREAARKYVRAIKPGSRIIFIMNPRAGKSVLNYLSIQAEMLDLLRKEKLL